MGCLVVFLFACLVFACDLCEVVVAGDGESYADFSGTDASHTLAVLNQVWDVLGSSLLGGPVVLVGVSGGATSACTLAWLIQERGGSAARLIVDSGVCVLHFSNAGLFWLGWLWFCICVFRCLETRQNTQFPHVCSTTNGNAIGRGEAFIVCVLRICYLLWLFFVAGLLLRSGQTTLLIGSRNMTLDMQDSFTRGPSMQSCGTTPVAGLRWRTPRE